MGAGPAGSITALYLAKAGVKVTVIEKRQEIGAPKRCAEGLGLAAIEEFGFTPHPRWAAQEIGGSVLYSPSMKRVSIESKYKGYVLERKVFEKFLAAEAIKAGARYIVKATVTDVIKTDGKVTGVEAEGMDGEFKVHSLMVIAADGVDSMTAKRAGINTVNKMSDYHSGFQYEMAGVSADETKIHLFFGNKIAPKGYTWIFPKGNTLANVGIGIVGTMSQEGKRAKDLLDDFIANKPQFFKNASPVEVNSGGIPVDPKFETLVADNFMIVGDAAHQVNPIHGGGIALAMRGGRIAAEVAACALKEGNTTKKRLEEYEVLWEQKEGTRLRKLMKLRLFLEKLDDEELEKLASVMDSDTVIQLVSGDVQQILKIVMLKAPKLLPLAKKFFD